MEFETKKINVTLSEDENIYKLYFDTIEIEIKLTEETTGDIEIMYEKLFSNMIENKVIYQCDFSECTIEGLFYEVSVEFIKDLNREIINSKNELHKIFSL